MKVNDVLLKAEHEAMLEVFIEENRPALEIRDKLDLGYRYDKWTFEICEIRPPWNDMTSGKKIWNPVAKAKYVKSRKIWKLYWMRASGKWELFPLSKEEPKLANILATIQDNPNGCFYG